MAEAGRGGNTIEAWTESEWAGRYGDASSGIVFYADDLDRTLAELQTRGLKLTGDDGRSIPTFTDPDGHWFQIVNPNDNS